jgi:hypothetical protein
VVVERSDAAEQIFRDIDASRRDALTRLLHALTDEELSALLTGHRALKAARAAYLAERAEETAAAEKLAEDKDVNGPVAAASR